jgi:hypothetical protein
MKNTRSRALRAALRCSAIVGDDELDDEQRSYLREFTTPRRALDGSLVWLLSEVEQCD